jgi:hypothetical protein
MSIFSTGAPWWFNRLVTDQVKFLLPRQFLDFRLAAQRIAAIRLQFRIYDFLRMAATKKPGALVRTGMFAETARHVGRNARIQAAVAGPDDVHEPVGNGIFGIGVSQSQAAQGVKIIISEPEIKAWASGLQSNLVIDY